MKVFKFGGASIKNAAAVRNMRRILEIYSGEQLIVVVSAMGKTTNALESIYNKKFRGIDFSGEFENLYNFHFEIGNDLFESSERTQKIIRPVFDELYIRLERLIPHENYDEGYDNIIPYGEIISSAIVYEYINSTRSAFQLLDARNLVITDDRYRDAGIKWDETCRQINETIKKNDRKNYITQGFIGKSEHGKMTTLGREGSDFTASIFGSCLLTESVTIWKDVPGILNGDPKRMEGTVLYENLSYQEAAEMSYYGASVIHPKTIKPLANKGIPLFVKSFENPQLPGTVIDSGHVHTLPPAFVIKDHQCLISFTRRDLEFINEKNLGQIFTFLDQLHVKINLMQNSAVSFSICVNQDEERVKKLVNSCGENFKVLYNDGLQLITVKNYTRNVVEEINRNKEILLEQKTRNTYQIVVRLAQT
jgi:aspartate kinase